MPNVVKLESERFPDRYVGVKPDGQVYVASGGYDCEFKLWREGIKKNAKYIFAIKTRQKKNKKIGASQGGGGGGGHGGAVFGALAGVAGIKKIVCVCVFFLICLFMCLF